MLDRVFFWTLRSPCGRSKMVCDINEDKGKTRTGTDMHRKNDAFHYKNWPRRKKKITTDTYWDGIVEDPKSVLET